MQAEATRPAARRIRPAALALALAGLLAGCSLAPTYRVPAVPMPAAYKDGSGLWTRAAPADMSPRGHWWTMFHDPELDRLEQLLDASSPSLALALARYERASAFESETRAGLFPHLAVGGGPSDNRQSDNRPLRGANQPNEYDADSAQFNAGYELDLWGRIRNEVAAGHAQAQAAQADLASARLSLEAQLADAYIQLRTDDIQARILASSLLAYQQGLTLTRNRMEGGIASGLSVARAQNQLSDAHAQVDELAAQRALTEHAIATLIGVPAPSFTLPASPQKLRAPTIPASVPSALLQRRPDIAAAERRTFAANANIGVARAAFFPSIGISGMYGWQDTGEGNLFAFGNRMWALGPFAALPLFDGGLRHAREREAQAAFDEAAAQYRQTVLDAFEQVEDNLALFTRLTHEAHDEDAAASSAQVAQQIATHRYTEGIINYLDVVTAQTAYLNAERAAQQVRMRRLQASVALVRALGGGWDVAMLAKPPAKQ
ncbi:efflux transporter outer membrane subunit [Dyella agri]|uniref:Efflux transporter outer membrane subunit n=1 Tax=Dyella agri TaxID=1926869 RepID=A0ABW8KKD9_9GAMM